MTGDDISTNDDTLLRIIRGVRNRWRLRVAAWGAAAVLGVTLVALVGATVGMEHFRFSDRSIVFFRALVYVVLGVAAAWFVVVPLLRRVSDEQVALYVEEHDPALQAALLSAVAQVRARTDVTSVSPALVGRLVAIAVERTSALEHGVGLERASFVRAGVIAGAVAVVGLLLVVLGPAFVRHGAGLVFVPWRTADAAPLYAIDVQPGSVTLPRGGDQRIAARLHGFASPAVELVVRRDTAGWERIPMEVASDSTRFSVRLFDIDAPTEYYVESNGVRSPVHRLTVADLPYVGRIDLEYRFPAYTGLAPDTVHGGGDIAAVRGTRVLVRVTPTMPVSAGRLVIEGTGPVPLSLDPDGTLAGMLTVERPGFYRVELADAGGMLRPASLEYVIDVLDDRAPSVRFVTPGRDRKATSIEEVFVSVEASDDFGIASLELRYSVNGGAEQRVSLHGPAARGLRELTAGHTFFLEELPLEPGDVIAYHARATDGNRVSGASTATSDIYFIEVRPFDRAYRQAEQSGGGGGGAGESPSVLSQQQREIVAATFRTIRDSATFSRAELGEHLTTLVLSQGRLRERVEALADRVRGRGVMSVDTAFRTIAEELPKAAAAMQDAENRLGKRDLRGALPDEQRALQHLQRAEAAYREVEVSFGGDPSGGGGGQSPAEDLADLFELETDKLRNQYETVQRGTQQQQDRERDELLERLRRLAARQQQENERLRQLAQSSRGQASGGGDAQRRMAQEAEELARRLERLAREQSSPELRESARRLQEAAAEMRRSAAAEGGEGLAGASSALRQLEEARRRLDEGRSSRVGSDVRDALRRATALAERQREIAGDAERLASRGATGGEAERLQERKNTLAADVADLDQRLGRIAREARGEQQETSRKLQDASGLIRQRRLEEKIRFSARVARSGAEEYVRNFEGQITADLDSVRQQVAEAAESLREGSQRRETAALDRARELVRGLESLQERTRGEGGAEEGTAQGQGEGRGQGRADAGAGRGTPGQGMPGGAGQGGGRIDPERARQLGREYRERRAGAEELRRELAREGLGVEELERLIARMRALEAQRTYDDAEELRRLQASVLEGFKAFEFALRRQLEGASADRPLLEGAADVPPAFRRLVEEYYRALGRGH